MTMHTQPPGATGAGCERDVAAAIFRVSLPHLAAGLYLRATRTQAGTLVQATYALASPAALPTVSGEGTARDLLLIDAVACRWGHRGDERTRTLWAFINP